MSYRAMNLAVELRKTRR